MILDKIERLVWRRGGGVSPTVLLRFFSSRQQRKVDQSAMAAKTTSLIIGVFWNRFEIAGTNNQQCFVQFSILDSLQQPEWRIRVHYTLSALACPLFESPISIQDIERLHGKGSSKPNMVQVQPFVGIHGRGQHLCQGQSHHIWCGLWPFSKRTTQKTIWLVSPALHQRHSESGSGQQ